MTDRKTMTALQALDDMKQAFDLFDEVAEEVIRTKVLRSEQHFTMAAARFSLEAAHTRLVKLLERL